MGGNAGRCRISVLALLVCAMLLSATMASAIRTGVADGMGAAGVAAAAVQAATDVTSPPVAATVQAATDVTPPPVAAAAVSPPSEGAALDDTYKDSKRKVPNGPDPIHNRRTRWGDAPARRV